MTLRGWGGTDDTSAKAVAKLSQANPGEIQMQSKYKQVWVPEYLMHNSSLHSLAVLKKEIV